MKKNESIKVVAFDADDTLWINEPLFQHVEKSFCQMFEDYMPSHAVSKELFKVEINNISDYGFGIKAYILSMIEAAIVISNKTIRLDAIEKIIHLGKELIHAPVVLLNDIEHVLIQLSKDYRLVVVTKGDLLDQQRKLQKSKLENYFHHIEIVVEKQENDYLRLLSHLDISPAEFMMIGNSLKSDILPVLNVGGFGIHIPYHTTWEYERIDMNIEHPNFKSVSKIIEVLNYL